MENYKDKLLLLLFELDVKFKDREIDVPITLSTFRIRTYKSSSSCIRGYSIGYENMILEFLITNKYKTNIIETINGINLDDRFYEYLGEIKNIYNNPSYFGLKKPYGYNCGIRDYIIDDIERLNKFAQRYQPFFGKPKSVYDPITLEKTETIINNYMLSFGSNIHTDITIDEYNQHLDKMTNVNTETNLVILDNILKNLKKQK